MQEMKYRFVSITHCNMCGSENTHHRILGKRLNQSQGKNPKSKTGVTTTVVKCTTCALIYSNPQPIPFDIQDHYGVPPETYWKDDYFLPSDSYFQYEIATLKKLMSIEKGMKALDIGAGLGKCMLALDKVGLETFGMEPSEPFYKKAIEKMQISPDKLKWGMMETIDYPTNEFDFITFGAVLEHLYSPADSIAQAMKWLKPNGIIHIEVPSSNWLISKFINFFYKLRGTDYVGNISPMHTPYHLHEFELKSFQLHGEKNGYDILFHEYYVCETFMPKIVDVFALPYMKWTNTGMQLCVWLRKK